MIQTAEIPMTVMTDFRRLALAALTLLASGLFALNTYAQPLTVYAVNSPLAYFAERIGGDLVDVTMPVPAGESPETWRPPLKVLRGIQKADLLILNGADYATWTNKVSIRRSRIVSSSKGLEDQFIALPTITHSHGGEEEHSHEGVAKKFWMSPFFASWQAKNILGALMKRLPDDELTLAQNFSRLEADLSALQLELLDMFAEDTVLNSSRTLHAPYGEYEYLSISIPAEVTFTDPLSLAEGVAILIPSDGYNGLTASPGITVVQTGEVLAEGDDWLEIQRSNVQALRRALTE